MRDSDLGTLDGLRYPENKLSRDDEECANEPVAEGGGDEGIEVRKI